MARDYATNSNEFTDQKLNSYLTVAEKIAAKFFSETSEIWKKTLLSKPNGINKSHFFNITPSFLTKNIQKISMKKLETPKKLEISQSKKIEIYQSKKLEISQPKISTDPNGKN